MKDKKFVNGRGIFAGIMWALFQLGVVISFVMTHSDGVTIASVTSGLLLCVGACCSGAALALKTQRKTDMGLTIAVGVLMVLELLCAGIALAASYMPSAIDAWDVRLAILAVFNIIFGVAALAVVTITDNTAADWAKHQADLDKINRQAELDALDSDEGRAILASYYVAKMQAETNASAPRMGLRKPLLQEPQQPGASIKQQDAPSVDFQSRQL